MTEIKGRAAVVTGGGSGIGMGLAKELAKQGASVAVADIILDNAKKIADEITAAGGKAVPIHCDVCDRDSLKAMKAAANKAFGPIQLVFANAGATNFEQLVDITEDTLDWIVQVNLMGVMNTAKIFLPDMIAGREGHIMATASMAGLLPYWIPVHVAYAAAKMGIIGAMLNLVRETEEHNVYTTTYCPGGVATSMGAKNSTYRPAKFGGPSDERVNVPKASFKNNQINMYAPEGIAPMVLRAVKNNRLFVFDHADQRRHFRETYAQIVEACYDDIETYEKEVGIPPVVRSRAAE
jgi:NAD(P)-dependent dehydrogenase (short-subunit alcohol dehydrogenase family)